MTDVTSGDFAVVVYREDDAWEAEVLPVALTENLDGLIHALRQQPSIGGTIGLAVVGDDFFVAMRVIGSQVSVFLSDLTASVDWPLARQVLEYLDIPVPDDEDLDQVLPAGDLSIFADLGIDEMELGALSGDLDLFPDEVLASIARQAGFRPRAGASPGRRAAPVRRRRGDGRLRGGLRPAMRAAIEEATRCGQRRQRPASPGTADMAWPGGRADGRGRAGRRRRPGRSRLGDRPGPATAARPRPTQPRTPRSWPSGRPQPPWAAGGWTAARWS